MFSVVTGAPRIIALSINQSRTSRTTHIPSSSFDFSSKLIRRTLTEYLEANNLYKPTITAFEREDLAHQNYLINKKNSGISLLK